MFVVQELTLVSVVASTWRCLVPLFASLSFVVLVGYLSGDEFVCSVSISTVLVKLTASELHPVSAHLCLVVHPEVFNVSQHFLARLESHLLLWPFFVFRFLCQIEPLLHLQKVDCL